MTVTQVKKFIRKINVGGKKEIVIRIDSKNLNRGVNRSRALLEKIEREVRIQRLELAVKKLKINRSWV